MKTSLYRFYSDENDLLYVGITRNPMQRLGGHFCEKDVQRIRYIEIEWFKSRDLAESAEGWAILRERPLWNISKPRKPHEPRATPDAAFAPDAARVLDEKKAVDRARADGVSIKLVLPNGEVY